MMLAGKGKEMKIKTLKNGKTRYKVEVRKNGRYASGTFDTQKEAKLFALKAEIEILSSKQNVTLSDVIKRYIDTVLARKAQNTQRQQRPQLNWWDKKLGKNNIHDITTAMIVSARDELSKKIKKNNKTNNVSDATLNRYTNLLNHVFNIASREWLLIDNNCIEKISRFKEPRGRIRYLNEEERKRLLTACKASKNDYLYPVVMIALSTGARKQEILNLSWGQIDFKRRVIMLNKTKNGERRALPISDLLHSVLVDYQKKCKHISDNDLVFQSQSDSTQSPNIFYVFSLALQQANIRDFRFHDLRHSAASYLAMNGATLAEIAEILGHKNYDIVKRYAHLSQSHTAKIVDKMNKNIFKE